MTGRTSSDRGGRSPHRIRRAGRCARGAALLEVVISISILLVAMSIVGLIFHNGEYHVELSEQMTRSAMMTERLLAEIETGYLKIEQEETVGYFGEESLPGMAWKVRVEPHERITGLLDVEIGIYMGDPAGPEEERKLILSTHVLRAEPQGIDFERDFGMQEEQVNQIVEMIPGGAAVFDPTNFDPRTLAGLDMEMLIELLPTLIEAFGGQLGAGQLQQIMQAVEGGGLANMQGMMQGMMDQGGGPGGGRFGGQGDGEGGFPGRGRRGGGEFGEGSGPDGGFGEGFERGQGGGRRGGRRGGQQGAPPDEFNQGFDPNAGPASDEPPARQGGRRGGGRRGGGGG